MHEASIAADILDMVRREMEKYSLGSLERISIRCGQLSCISAASLKFNLEAMTEGSPLAGAAIIINKIPVELLCSSCQKNFSAPDRDHLFVPCPHCSSEGGRRVIKGQELSLDSIEGE